MAIVIGCECAPHEKRSTMKRIREIYTTRGCVQPIIYIYAGLGVRYIILFITFARGGELKCKHGIFCNRVQSRPTTPPHPHIHTYFAYKCSVYFLFYVHTFSTYQFSLYVPMYVYLMIYDIYYARVQRTDTRKKRQQPERINIINF